MAVGDLWKATRQAICHAGRGPDDSQSDAKFSQLIHRVDLSMKFRGLSRLDSLMRYGQLIQTTRRLASQHRINEIHAARPLFEGLVARCVKALTGVPYSCFVHGEDVNVAMTSRELKILTSSVLKHASKVIANSSFTHQLLIDDWRVPKDRLVKMNPGVDCEYFHPAEDAGLRPDKWRDKLVILTVGRLQQRKGHDTVLHALSTLVDRFPNLLYAIAGNGDQRWHLENLAKQLGVTVHVEFLDEIDDASLLVCYQHCDVFVLANRGVGRDVEGFGIVLLEAQACGIPVVAGASGGTSDTMIDKETGFLVPCETPHNPEELVRILGLLLHDPELRRTIGVAGRAFMLKRFDWHSLSAQASQIHVRLVHN